jgi:ADP-ribose pyrophosphatase YjhB (NUDIX family)
MRPEPEELLNVYDAAGAVVGHRGRAEAKSQGLPVGAVNVLIVNGRGEVLLQRRIAGKENGGRWDKTVGGHVAAGEDFDQTARRECGEELFGDAAASRVTLVDLPALTSGRPRAELERGVVIAPIARHLNLRDVRLTPDGGIRNVLYHVGIYAGRTEMPVTAFQPQASEVTDLTYFVPGVVDLLMLRSQLAPNMAFLWLAYGEAVLRLAETPAR